MKSLHLLCLALALLIGCATVPENASFSLPDTTPFDASPSARIIYLDAYRDGYRSALTRGTSEDIYLQGYDSTARKLGWRAGVAAGLRAKDKAH